MKKKNRQLPRPARTPFGRPGGEAEGEPQPLMADALAMAAAEGRLDEFMKRELPDSDYARSLVSMMMGMTGMAHAGGRSSAPSDEAGVKEEAQDPPKGVMAAVGAGDVAGLMGLLKAEHEKRVGSAPEVKEEQPVRQEISGAEQEVLDSILGIAAGNGLAVDWLILRALKLYVEEYRKTGRL